MTIGRGVFLNCRLTVLWLSFGLVPTGCQPPADRATEDGTETAPHVVAESRIEAGRYLAIIGGCNDCHTAGYLQTEGDVPEEQWLAGSRLGWRGPWGTTYAANLRLRVQELSEDAWVQLLHTRKALPPMGWMNINQMSDSDARAVYHYIRALGPIGEPMPIAVPPDGHPTTPYISLMPIEPDGQ